MNYKAQQKWSGENLTNWTGGAVPVHAALTARIEFLEAKNKSLTAVSLTKSNIQIS